MNDPIGFVLVLFLKLLIVIGINYLLIRWLRKNETTLKIIVCWVLGLYLNLSQPISIYDSIFQNFFAQPNDCGLMCSSAFYSGQAGFFGLITYFVVGFMFYKKKL